MHIHNKFANCRWIHYFQVQLTTKETIWSALPGGLHWKINTHWYLKRLWRPYRPFKTDLIDTKLDRLNIGTYEAIQTVKYSLMASQVFLFSRLVYKDQAWVLFPLS